MGRGPESCNVMIFFMYLGRNPGSSFYCACPRFKSLRIRLKIRPITSWQDGARRGVYLKSHLTDARDERRGGSQCPPRHVYLRQQRHLVAAVQHCCQITVKSYTKSALSAIDIRLDSKIKVTTFETTHPTEPIP